MAHFVPPTQNNWLVVTSIYVRRKPRIRANLGLHCDLTFAQKSEDCEIRGLRKPLIDQMPFPLASDAILATNPTRV